jgi:glycosyltransferase involved in cell wall biosynthesis
MVDFYMGLDVYAHASLTEAFNNTIIEALSCNVPVIMTKTGAWRKFKGYVTFVEPTYQGLYRALKKYAGRRLVMGRFIWPLIVPRYKAIYERIHKKNQPVERPSRRRR